MVRGTRQLAIVLVAMAAAVMLASGLAVAATFTGTNGNDNIKGTDQADEIYGEAGKDTLKGMAANDKVFGGADDDTLYGDDSAATAASGDDNVQGEEGNDKVFGGPDKDVVKGGPGNDIVYGDTGADTLQGGADNDTITAGPLEEAAVDTVDGGDGDDTIYAPNLPASKDVIDCGVGTDKVTADSLDVLTGCENVERMQEEEPSLPDGTYTLTPSPSSECNMGEGSLTLSNDPETGERGVDIQLTPQQAPQQQEGAFTTCEIDVDYQSATPAAQDGASAQSAGTATYEGTKVETDQAIKEQASQDVVDDSTDPAPASNEVGAQYAWTRANFKSWLTTRDPVQYRLAETYSRITWWHNGYSTSYSSRNKNYYSRTNPVYWPITHWYTDYNVYVGGPWSDKYGVHSRVASKFHNWDFQNDDLSTRVYHNDRVMGNKYGTGYVYAIYAQAYGEYYWLLNHRVTWCRCF